MAKMSDWHIEQTEAIPQSELDREYTDSRVEFEHAMQTIENDINNLELQIMKHAYLMIVDLFGYSVQGCESANQYMSRRFKDTWEMNREEIWMWLDDIKLYNKI